MTAATNVIILWNTNGSYPSGWTDTGVDHAGRFIYIGATVGSHGGADTHTHSYSSVSSGNSTTSTHNAAGTTGNYDSVQTHNHTMTNTAVSSETSLPPYKNYGLYYRSLTGWDGKVPAGTIAMCATVPTNWTRVDDGSAYFIRVVAEGSTLGGTGGASTHTHTLSGTLAALTSTSNLFNITANYAIAKDHGHTYSGSSSSQSNSTNLYYLGAGLVKADVETHITQNMYVWFDGDVPSTFTQINDQGYLQQASGNTYTNGGSGNKISHAHDSFNITSGAMSNSVNTQEYSLGAAWHVKAHTHSVTGSLASGDVQPSYVGLTMGKAKADFYSTPTKTYTMDTKFFGTANLGYSVDRRLKGTATHTYSVDRRLKGTVNLTEDSDVILQKAFTSAATMDTSVVAYFLESACDMETTIKADTPKTYTLDALVQKQNIESTYDAEMPLLKTVDNSNAKLDVCVQNTFTKTYSIDLLAQQDKGKTYTVGFYGKGANEAVLDAECTIVLVKRTGYSGRCNVQLQDIQSGYGMGLELTNRPRTYKQQRPVPYIATPDTVDETVNVDSITASDIPGPQTTEIVYPSSEFPREDNPVTPEEYNETRGNEPNKKRPFKVVTADSTLILDLER